MSYIKAVYHAWPTQTTQMWSDTKSIVHLKKLILTKKILMAHIIESYNKIDKFFRLVHWFFMILTPVLTFINELFFNKTPVLNKLILVSSTVSVGLTKLKSSINYVGVQNEAKSQIVKYDRLYQRIENELLKPPAKQQAIDEFVYWITREYNAIELADPEVSYETKQKFIQLCAVKGIKHIDDVDTLAELNEQHKQEMDKLDTKSSTKWARERLDNLN